MSEVRQILESRFKTSFIGNIAAVEEAMGHLWKQGAPYDELTPEEKTWRVIWKGVRDKILDHSNRQRRLATEEIENLFGGSYE